MKKSVNLKIKSSQFEEKLAPSGEAFVRELELADSVEIQTEGTLYTKNNSIYIAYDESEKLGLNDAKTLIKLMPSEGRTDDAQPKSLGDKTLHIRRYCKGEEDNMDMALQQGKLNITRYKIPQVGSMDIQVYTNKLEDELNEEGYGRIFVDYKIKFDEVFSRRNQIEINIGRR